MERERETGEGEVLLKNCNELQMGGRDHLAGGGGLVLAHGHHHRALLVRRHPRHPRRVRLFGSTPRRALRVIPFK